MFAIVLIKLHTLLFECGFKWVSSRWFSYSQQWSGVYAHITHGVPTIGSISTRTTIKLLLKVIYMYVHIQVRCFLVKAQIIL